MATGTRQVDRSRRRPGAAGKEPLLPGVMVVLPLAALMVEAARPGARRSGRRCAIPIAWHSLKLTFVTAFVMVLVNAVTGTATAWVLVRYDFPGRGLVNALIDLPFAVPTVVTGVMLIVLFGPSSVVGTILGRYGWSVIYHQPGIVLALVVRDLSVRDPERAAGAHGAGSGRGRGGVDAGGGRVDDVSPGHAAGALALDRDRLGLVVRAGPGRIRQRGHGGGQPAAGDQDRRPFTSSARSKAATATGRWWFRPCSWRARC